MIGIKVNGGFLDLPEEASITFEFNNTGLLIGEENETIPTSYSFPLTIPLTDNNRRLLDYPDLVDSAAYLVQDAPCEMHFNTYLFSGLLTVRNAGRRQAKLYIIVNPSVTLKDTNLNEIDYGGDIDISSPSPTGHAKQTAYFPLDQGYVFFPVRTPNFFTGSENDPDTAESKISNYWDSSEEFMDDATQQNAMPFARIAFLIEKIYAHIGYPMEDLWMTTDELKMLCLWNNRSIYTEADQWADTINLQNHVPDQKANEFLKQLFSLFGIGVFYDLHENLIQLRPMRDVLTSEPVWDWTSKAEAEYDLSYSANGFKRFDHGMDGADTLFDQYNTDPPLPSVDTIIDILDTTTATQGEVFYVIADNTFYIQNAPTPFVIAKKLIGADSAYVRGQKDFVNEMPPLFIYPSVDVDIYSAWTGVGGYHEVYEDVRTEYKTPRLIWYRGIEDEGAWDYPFANTTAYSRFGTTLFDNSLMWNETNNLYDTWLSELNDVTNTGKIVKRKVHLNIRDFLNFRMHHKVRIGNMNYLVKQLRVTFKGSRMSSEATLVTTT